MIPAPFKLHKGLVIVFEGIDGAGKTTQINLANDILTKAGWETLYLRNLGGTPIGETLRNAIKAPIERPPMTDLYTSLAIQEALILEIDKARKNGKIVLMDRGPLSLAAYQVYGSGIDKKIGMPYVEDGMNRIKPDTTLLYNVDINQAITRARNSSSKPDYFENKPLSYFQKVSDGYNEMVGLFPIDVIDGDTSIEEVSKQTMSVIAAKLELLNKA